MEKKDFPKGTKPREIFVYTCERIAEPLNPLGYKYRKSKNDIYKKDGMSNSRVSTWSGIRNKLENDYLCPALRGHIQYFATSYSKSADHEGRAAIRVDGVEVLRSNYYTYFENVWTKFHHLRSTTLKDHDSAKEAINQAHAYALEQGTFDQKVFYLIRDKRRKNIQNA